MYSIYKSALIVFLLAIIPAAIWYYAFHRKHKINISTWIFAFLMWWLSSLPVLYYWDLWWAESNLIFFKIVHIENYQDNIVNLFWFDTFDEAIEAITWDYFYVAILASLGWFLWIWFSEEVAKHIVINPKLRWTLRVILFWVLVFSIVNPENILVIVLVLLCICFLYMAPEFLRFKSINDIVIISIYAAIWFACLENISYFWYKWDSIVYNLNWESFKAFLDFVLIRSTLSSMVHVLCSWIFWYHFALFFFSKQKLKYDARNNNSHKILFFINRFISNPPDKIYGVIHILIGLTLSIFIHWIYDILVRVDLNIFWVSLLILAIPMYFLGWFIYLYLILENKDNFTDIWRLTNVK